MDRFVGSMLPHALLAVEPNVSTDAKTNVRVTRDGGTCIQVPDTYRTTGPYTVPELEAESVPSGKGNAEWKQFLSQLRKGDKLLRYDEGCCTGIIIVRKGCIVDWFQISQS